MHDNNYFIVYNSYAPRLLTVAHNGHSLYS